MLCTIGIVPLHAGFRRSRQCQMCRFFSGSISLSKTGVSMPFVHEDNAKYAELNRSQSHAHLALSPLQMGFRTTHNDNCANSSQAPSLYRRPVCQCHLCKLTMPIVSTPITDGLTHITQCHLCMQTMPNMQHGIGNSVIQIAKISLKSIGCTIGIVAHLAL